MKVQHSRLAIVGSTALAQTLAHHALESGEWAAVVGFFDDFRAPGEETGRGPILGSLDEVVPAFESGLFDALIVAIGYHHLALRERCFQRFSKCLPMGRVTARGCRVDASARLGEGTFLLPGCVLDHGVSIEPNCVLNTGVVIAHESRVGEASFLAPGTTLAGFVNVGRRCFLGVGTVVSDSLTIADDVQTGAGTVVVDSLQRPGLYLGVPARFIRPLG